MLKSKISDIKITLNSNIMKEKFSTKKNSSIIFKNLELLKSFEYFVHKQNKKLFFSGVCRI